MDSVRALLISPEMLCILLPIALWFYWPAPAELVTTLIHGDLKWSFGAALIPFGFLATCYHFGTDVLFPEEGRSVLLAWPNYILLKTRVVMALIYCVVAILIVCVGIYWIAKTKSSFGTTLILAGWFSSSAAIFSVALAKWKIRELLNDAPKLNVP
ncbi:MAG: hypothetical protein AB1540_17645 [Bdellovibrionota bacterium]